MPATMLDRADSGVHQVAAHLVAEFDGALRSEVVERVVLAARRDLDREVPPEALAQFLHRLAWQRLVDLHAGTASNDPSCATYPRRSGPDE